MINFKLPNFRTDHIEELKNKVIRIIHEEMIKITTRLKRKLCLELF